MPDTIPDAAPARPTPTLPQLLAAFTMIAVFGFGGVLYWSRRMMVEERRWMTADEFNDAYALCNFLPGPNIVNFAVVFGRQIGGTAGAFLALLGLLGPPFTLVVLFGLLYAHYGNIDVLQRMFVGVAADVMHRMSDRQFADLFAIAQVTPGPNVIVVTLIGFHVAGLAGALVATLAMCGPTCVFAFFIGRIWDRFKEARWRLIIQAAL